MGTTTFARATRLPVNLESIVVGFQAMTHDAMRFLLPLGTVLRSLECLPCSPFHRNQCSSCRTKHHNERTAAKQTRAKDRSWSRHGRHLLYIGAPLEMAARKISDEHGGEGRSHCQDKQAFRARFVPHTSASTIALRVHAQHKTHPLSQHLPCAVLLRWPFCTDRHTTGGTLYRATGRRTQRPRSYLSALRPFPVATLLSLCVVTG